MKNFSFDEIVQLEKSCGKTVGIGDIFKYKGLTIVKATDDRYILLEEIKLDEINYKTILKTFDRPKSKQSLEDMF